jgi:transcriptional regulator with XRE-family HTH domain
MPTNGPVGERIAIYRRRRGLSQVVLAGLIGRSVSWLSQVERGIRAVDRMSVLIDLSRVLKVDIAELTGQPFALAPNGGLEPEGLADIRRVLMRYTELPAAINPGPGAVTTASDLTQLRSRVDTAWRLRQASRYAQLGHQVPDLITQAEQATQHYRGDDQRAAFALLAETYQVTRAMLRKLGDAHLAWIAADRAVRAGRHAESPLLIAVGARALSQVFTETGQLDAALDISLSSAAALEPRLRGDRSGPQGWSVWGALLLTAALAAARDNDIGAASDYLRRAGRAADHLHADRNDLWTSFGPPMSPSTASQSPSNSAMSPKPSGGPSRSIPQPFRPTCWNGAHRSSSTWAAPTSNAAMTPPPPPSSGRPKNSPPKRCTTVFPSARHFARCSSGNTAIQPQNFARSHGEPALSPDEP